MLDHFATLARTRRPWLDAEVLKEEFHRRSTTLHPDVPGTGDATRFAELNAAYAVLREPATRLRHLLELLDPAALKGIAAPPVELGEEFMVLAGLSRRLDKSREQRAGASAPLALALLAGGEADLRDEFSALLRRVESATHLVLEEVRMLDATWSGTDPTELEALARCAHRLAYLTRWLAQTREVLFKLGA
jgi:curved DNA-binding protein CbpA